MKIDCNRLNRLEWKGQFDKLYPEGIELSIDELLPSIGVIDWHSILYFNCHSTIYNRYNQLFLELEHNQEADNLAICQLVLAALESEYDKSRA